MTEQELKEIYDLLEKAGMNPQLCCGKCGQD